MTGAGTQTRTTEVTTTALLVLHTGKLKTINVIFLYNLYTGLLVAHFENIGFYIGSSYSKYRLFTGFSIKNIG